MKLSVLLNSTRADDTITAVKTLLTQASPDNQLQVIVRVNNPDLENALAKYLPKDDRIMINGTPDGDKAWTVGDTGLELPSFWDLDQNIAKNFVDYTPKMAENGVISQNHTTDGVINGEVAQNSTPSTVVPPVPQTLNDLLPQKIGILIPTRGRPENMQRVVDSIFQTATNPQEIGIYFYIDSDDIPSQTKAAELNNQYAGKITWIHDERIVLSQMWNRCYEIAATSCEIFMHAGDDLIFRSQGWDEQVRNAFLLYPDRIVFVHGNDGYWGEQFGTHGFIHKNWVDVVGYFVPPYFSSDFNDTWLNDVANAIGRRKYLPEVFTEHMHYVFGKAERDQTHQEREMRGSKDNVNQKYVDTYPQRQQDANKLADAIGIDRGTVLVRDFPETTPLPTDNQKTTTVQPIDNREEVIKQARNAINLANELLNSLD